jgi:hypothetical protein
MAEPTPKQISDYYAKNNLNREQRGQGGMLLRDLPGTPQFNAEQMLRYEAETKPAAAASTPIPVLTPEQRQANIARDLALSQTRGARPSGQDSQFYQPVYQSQYTNYARPSTQFDTSLYGVQPMNSASVSAGMSRGDITNVIENFYGTNPLGSNATATDVLNFMRNNRVNREDFQAAAGKNNYNPQKQSPSNYSDGMSGGMGGGLTPELARTLMQRSMTSSGVPTSEFQRFGGYDAVKALYDKSGGDYSGQGNPYPQQQFNPYTNQYQTPLSYQQPQYQQQQMQTPFSYQQPQYQQQQMQSPFSYQQPQYQQYQQYQQPMQQPVAQRMSSGPSQAIVGRSSQTRGTPNVMRRAKGGITSLLKKDK